MIPRQLAGVVDPGCRGCGLYRFRKNVVAGRGSIPADLMLIGEAPGRQEDLQGVAFFGKAGRLLNKGIDVACSLAGLTEPPLMYITNICGCRPTDKMHGENRKPTAEEAAACLQRLCGTIRVVKPLVIVFMGEVAKKYGKCIPDEAFDGQRLTMMHPSACGYRGGASGPLFRPMVQSLVVAFEAVKTAKEGEDAS